MKIAADPDLIGLGQLFSGFRSRPFTTTWSSKKKRRFWLALLSAAIFAAHPLGTESVVYIAGRSASLVGAFYLAGLYVVLRAGRAKSSGCYTLLLLFVVFAVVGSLVKQDAMTLPVASVALIWLAWPIDAAARQRWIGTAVSGFALLLVFLTQIRSFREVSAIAQSNTSLVVAGYETTLPFVSYALTSIKAYSAYYLWRLWVPVALSVDPEVIPVGSIMSLGLVTALIVLLAAVCGVLWFRLQRPLLATGLALVLTSPLSAYCLFPLADVVAEHRAYLAIVGSAVVLADILLRNRHALWISLVMLVAYGCLTIERNQVWADEFQLWKDASRKAPEKVRPHINLAVVYQSRGQADRAIEEYEFVLRRHPDHTMALTNLAALHSDRILTGERRASPRIDDVCSGSHFGDSGEYGFVEIRRSCLR